MRKSWGVTSVRNKVTSMIKAQEQIKKAANSMNSNNSAGSLLIEKEK